MRARKSPGGGSGAIRNDNAGGVTFMVPEAADEYVQHVDGGYVVVVHTTAGRYRRRVYLSLRSAELAVRRARERGHGARIVLAVLTPLYVVSGTAQPDLWHDANSKTGPPGVGSTERALTNSLVQQREGSHERI